MMAAEGVPTCSVNVCRYSGSPRGMRLPQLPVAQLFNIWLSASHFAISLKRSSTCRSQNLPWLPISSLVLDLRISELGPLHLS